MMMIIIKSVGQNNTCLGQWLKTRSDPSPGSFQQHVETFSVAAACRKCFYGLSSGNADTHPTMHETTPQMKNYLI